MKPFVEIITDYIDDNGVQHLDGYTTEDSDEGGCVVGYFINGEVYYTNPDFQFDELVKATVAGLKMEFNKTAQGKYKDVIDSVRILQLPETAISDEIIKRMNVGLAFIDADVDLDEKIYFGTVFGDIMNNHTDGYNEVPRKFLRELNDLIELVTEYEYIMLTKV